MISARIWGCKSNNKFAYYWMGTKICYLRLWGCAQGRVCLSVYRDECTYLFADSFIYSSVWRKLQKEFFWHSKIHSWLKWFGPPWGCYFVVVWVAVWEREATQNWLDVRIYIVELCVDDILPLYYLSSAQLPAEEYKAASIIVLINETISC